MKIIQGVRSPYHIHIMNVFRRHNVDMSKISLTSKKFLRATIYDISFPDEYEVALPDRYKKLIKSID